MKLLFWKHTEKILIFANELADDFYNEVKPDMALAYFSGTEGSSDKKTRKKAKQGKLVNVRYKLDQMEQHISAFKKQEKLGVYGKARLHLALQGRLRELGYDGDVVNKINQSLLFKLN